MNSNQRGFILIIAMAMLSVLAVLSMEYSRLARNSSERAFWAEQDLSGFYAAESGVEWTKMRLAADTGSPDTLNDAWRDSGVYVREVGGWEVQVRVTDEASKIDLNSASAALLSELFEQFDMDKTERDVLAASLLDWIDTGDLHRTNGAESDYYESKGYPYGAKNASLDGLDELLKIRGAPADLLDRAAEFGDDSYVFRDCVTVEGDTRVNVNTAPPPVLRALGFTESEVEKVLEERAGTPFSSLSGLSAVLGAARSEVLKPQLRVSSNLFLVESTARRQDASPVSVFALLRRYSRRIYTAGFWT